MEALRRSSLPSPHPNLHPLPRQTPMLWRLSLHEAGAVGAVGTAAAAAVVMAAEVVSPIPEINPTLATKIIVRRRPPTPVTRSRTRKVLSTLTCQPMLHGLAPSTGEKVPELLIVPTLMSASGLTRQHHVLPLPIELLASLTFLKKQIQTRLTSLTHSTVA